MQKIRIVILVATLIVSYATVGWMRSGFNIAIDEPPVPLADVPMQLGTWSGQDVELTDETTELLNAHSMINRNYVDPTGRQISLHAAIWVNAEFATSAPHHPEICYPAAGWIIVDRRRSEFSTAAGDLPVEMIHFRKDQQEVVSCHWFQMGDVSYTNQDEFKAQRSKFWGAKSWPCTMKFLLSTPQYSIDRAEPILLEFAALVCEAIQARSPTSGPDAARAFSEVKSLSSSSGEAE